MNLRILKKLSKRAAPYLPLLGDRREQFPARPGDNYHGLIVSARKHWERSHCHPNYEPWNPSEAIVWTTRAGRRALMKMPSHPWPGTIMVGETSGYYEPEWSEECAYAALANLVYWHFTEWSDEGEPRPTRRIRAPRDIFRGADQMIEDLRTPWSDLWSAE